jgi:hypothetical protein
MPIVGFERTIPMFQLAKTVHALDRTVTVIVCLISIKRNLCSWAYVVFAPELLKSFNVRY